MPGFDEAEEEEVRLLLEEVRLLLEEREALNKHLPEGLVRQLLDLDLDLGSTEVAMEVMPSCSSSACGARPVSSADIGSARQSSTASRTV